MRRQLGGSPTARIDRLSDAEKEENKEFWKAIIGYERSWIVEIIISAFKRMFGDHLHLRKWFNMMPGDKLGVTMWNRWLKEAGATTAAAMT